MLFRLDLVSIDQITIVKWHLFGHIGTLWKYDIQKLVEWKYNLQKAVDLQNHTNMEEHRGNTI